MRRSERCKWQLANEFRHVASSRSVPRGLGNLLLWLGRNPAVRERVLHSLAGNAELFTRLLAIHAGRGKRSQMIATRAAPAKAPEEITTPRGFSVISSFFFLALLIN
jgi:hypothetical protein